MVSGFEIVAVENFACVWEIFAARAHTLEERFGELSLSGLEVLRYIFP
jgi:hypothetical protein